MKNRELRKDTAECENKITHERSTQAPKGQEAPKKATLLMCTDSHGRDLAFHLNHFTNKFDAVGFVKPGGCTSQILIEDYIDGEQLEAEDILLIMAGSNDIARNEADGALNYITRTIKKYKCHKIV